jgi:hypothetical protein
MKKALFFFFCLWQSVNLYSQATGDFRSNGNGNWNVAATWQRFDGANWVAAPAPPSQADGVITIRSPHIVTAISAITADQVTVASGATLNINSNTFSLADGMGTDLQVNGTLKLLSTLTGSGSASILNGGTMEWTSGTLSVNLTIASGATLNINTSTSRNFSGGKILTNRGTINWTQGNINFTNATLLNEGLFSATTIYWLVNSAGTNLFHNTATGTFTRNPGIVTHINVPTLNEGKINTGGGQLSLGSTFTNRGTIHFAAPGTVTISGTFESNTGSQFTGTGTILITGDFWIVDDLDLPSSVTLNLSLGAIRGAWSLDVNGPMNWTGGTIAGRVSIKDGSTLTISSSSIKYLDGYLAIDEEATAKWNAGTLSLRDEAHLQIIGVFDNTFDGNILNGGGNNIIDNIGLFIKSGGSGTTTISVPFVNDGSIAGIQSLNFTADFNNKSNIKPGFTTHSFGSPGILSVNTSVSPLFSDSSVLVIELLNGSGPGTGHDQLRHNGNLVLNGALVLIETDIAPDGIYTFLNLTSGTISGAFDSVMLARQTQDSIIVIGLPPNYSIVTTSTTVTLIKSSPIPVPVLLIDFTLKNINNRVLELNWRTASEQNSDYFIVERSQDANQYVEIGRVKAAGNSNSITYYQFTDHQPEKGLNHYRLKQVDKDGKIFYSKLVMAKLTFTSPVIIAPNPVKNTLHILSQPFNRLEITDLQGRVVKHFSYQTSQLYDVSSLPAGVFLVRVYMNNEAATVRMTKE